jgi:hypothetical protein
MSNSVLATFTNYQKSRIQFVQSLAELSKRKENFEDITSLGGLLLLRPLITDVVPSIAQTACIALGRLAAESAEIATNIVQLDILPHIVQSMSDQSRLFKKCASFVLRSVARHNADLGRAIIEHDGLTAISHVLDDHDPGVKEAGCWALSYISKHNEELAGAVADVISLERIIDCVKEPEISLKRIAVNCLTQIAKQGEDLAKRVATKETGLMAHLCPMIDNPDVLLRRQALACLAQIASGKQELAEQIVKTISLEKLMKLFQEEDVLVKVNAVELTKNLMKHSAEIAKLMSNAQAEKHLVRFLSECPAEAREGVLETLIVIASFNETLANNLLGCSADEVVLDILRNSQDPKTRNLCIQFLGAVSQNSGDQSGAVGQTGGLSYLLGLLTTKGGKGAHDKEVLRSISNIIKNYKDISSLLQLIRTPNLPLSVLAILCKRIAVFIQADAGAKKAFAAQRGLETIWDIKKKLDPSEQGLGGVLDDICNQYPDELVRLFNPDYPAMVIRKMTDYNSIEK